jgi:regulator of cell morphogenesis and NO signaling
MEKEFKATSKTGDIVTKFPMASQLFKQNKIDFCCGGDRPIGETLAEKSLDVDIFLDKLNTMYLSAKDASAKETDWTNESYGSLIDHVVNTHHAYLNSLLPELSTFVSKIYRVHGMNHPELEKVYRLFHELKMEVEHHLIQEEVDIFPKIKQYENARTNEQLDELISAIDKLESEHDASGNLLKELREITKDYYIPEDACKSYTLTYLKLEELESDMFQHIHLENNILFPRIAQEKTA